jgi:hypothetical protein
VRRHSTYLDVLLRSLLGCLLSAVVTATWCWATLGPNWVTLVAAVLAPLPALLLSLPCAELTANRSRASRLVPVGVAGSLAGAAVAFLATEFMSPAALFRRTVAASVPASVRILDGWESPALIGPEVFLHFTISPDDLDTILRAGSYTEDQHISGDFRGFRAPAWWAPQHLGDGLSVFECEIGARDAEGMPDGRKYIVVNRERTEVYFLWFLYW